MPKKGGDALRESKKGMIKNILFKIRRIT